MRLALDMALPQSFSSLSIGRVDGTLWSATLRDVSLDGVNLGTVQARSNPLNILSGAPLTRLSWQSKASTGTSAASHRAGRLVLSDVSGRFVANGPSVQGIVALDNAVAEISQQGCIDARGAVTFTPSSNRESAKGQLVCENGSLAAQMVFNGVPVTLPLAVQ
ncbi:MAG: type II secretion system protein N [Pseudomonadota bacterium]